MPAPSPQSTPLTHAQAYGLLALVVCVWGANWPTMKVGLVALIVEGDADPDWSLPLYYALVYNGPIATAFAFWASTSISRSLPAVTSTLSFLAVPAMGILLSSLALGERPDATLLGGFGLILAGVVLVNLADRRVP